VVIQLRHHEGIPVEHTLDRNSNHPAMKQESQPFTVDSSFFDFNINSMTENPKIPKWKLKANWLLKELIRIWQGYTDPKSLFERQIFVHTFKKIMEQYLEDRGSSAPQAELDICLTKSRITFSARHGSTPAFTSQAMEADWIAEAVAIHRLDFELITDDTIKSIIRLASAIEDILQTCGTIPSDYLHPLEELLDRSVPDINELPAISIEK